jgi:hypothetical protein
MPTVISELTGEEIDRSSEQFRHECECRWLLDKKPSRADKHLWLYGVRDRAQLFDFNPKTGRDELSDDWKKRIVSDTPPVIVHRGLAAADRILEDARRIYEARQRKASSAA